MSEVLVLADYSDAGLKRVTRELLTAAARIGTPAAVLVGTPGVGDRLAADLAQAGAATIYLAEHDRADTVAATPAVAALAAAAERADPAAVLVASVATGHEIVGRIAARLDAGVISDVVDLTRDGDRIIATQSIFGGNYTVRSAVTRGIPVIAVRPNAIDADVPAGAGNLVPVEISLDDTAVVTITASHPEPVGDRPELGAATVVVSGGRGVGSAENFAVVEALADALGGAVGASRAAVDSGYYPHQFQVGQTGVTVSPQLYIALGISGAIQHRAGMQTSKTIVAVNKDADAPIFEISDFGVVGDLFDVAPQLTEAVRSRRQG